MDMDDAELGCPLVTVYVNGAPAQVPCEVKDPRRWLAVPRDADVYRERGRTGRPRGDAITFRGGHVFHEGDRYVTPGAVVAGA